MKCHYEVLEVLRDADDSQIKTAYRKQALRWHPDKNLDNPEYAKEQFQLVQQAYEVLSDRLERTWYDNHREQILRGKDSEFTDASLDVFQYFTTTCFKGYNDSDQGFYTVYRKVFEQIAQEDIEYMDDKEELQEIPTFGTSTSDYEEVVGPFYAYWTSYNTKKSYVWLDPYNSTETRDRRAFKLMEKENKKVRQKAKKERNEEVRALVAFVRKRDKRVQENSKKLEARILENRQKQEELSRQRRAERRKELSELKSQPEWAKFDNVKTELKEIEKRLAAQFGEQISDSEDEHSDASDQPDCLYCSACNKVFKTPKAFQNHELSKKHKENVEKLRLTLIEEDESLQDDECSESEEEVEIEMRPKKKPNKQKSVLQANLSDTEDLSSTNMQVTEDDEDNFDFNHSKKKKRKNKKTTVAHEQQNKTNRDTLQTDDGAECANISSKQEEQVEKSKEKRKNKRSKQKPDAQPNDIDTSHCCVTCKADFPSKNKLFDHLKKTGHSVYLHQQSMPAFHPAWASKQLINTMSRRIQYPAAERNKGPILEVLKKHFDSERTGNVLEISSGTGQHAAYFAEHFPNLTFQPSEYERSLVDSIKAYARHTPIKNNKKNTLS